MKAILTITITEQGPDIYPGGKGGIRENITYVSLPCPSEIVEVLWIALTGLSPRLLCHGFIPL